MKTARLHAIPLLACTVCVIAGALLAVWLRRETSREETRMIVEALIPSGSRFGLYYNDRRESDRLPIDRRKWHSYVFKIPSKLNVLRFDPTEIPGTVSQIRSITFTKGGVVVRQMDLSTIPAWVKSNTEITFDRASGIVSFNATGSDQFAMSRVDIDLGWSPLPSMDNTPVLLIWGCLLAAFIYFFLQNWGEGWMINRSWALIILIAVEASHLAPWAISQLHLAASAPDKVVGNPTYNDVSKNAEIFTMVAGIGFAVAVVFAGALLIQRLKHRQTPRLGSESIGVSRRDYAFVSLLVAIFAVLSFPDLKGICALDLQVVHPFAFDPQISCIWQEMAHRGLLPDRDYWYPYSGLYNKLSPLNPELLWNYLHNSAVFTAMAFGTYVLFGKRKLASAIVLLPLLPLLEATGTAWPDAMWRYILGISVIVLFSAALCTRRVGWFLVSGAWAAYILSQESPQLVYSLPALLFLVVAVLALERDRLARFRLFKLIGICLGSFAMLSACWVAMMVSEHRFAEWWNYMSNLKTQAGYFAFPFDIRVWFQLPDSIESFGYLVLMLLFITAAIQIFRCRNRVPPSHLAPFAIAIAIAMMMQKEVLRPGIMSQFIAVPLFGLLMVLVQYSPQTSEPSTAILPVALRMGWAGFASTFLLTLFVFIPGAWTDLESHYVARLAAWKENLSYAFGHQAEWSATTAYYFSPQSIVMDDTRGDIAKADFQKAIADAPGEVFALGDCAYWYLLLGQQPPFYFMFFHQAPLDAQQNTQRWLETHRPRYVIWEPSKTSLDGIPDPVRMPLLYTYIAANYVPSMQVRQFLVLRRRLPGERADLSFWTKTLGSSIDLGYIPALSNIGKGLTNRPLFPIEYLLVSVAHPATGKTRVVSVMLGDTPLAISFQERQSVVNYPIRLDRIAQVTVAAANGVLPKVTNMADAQLSVQSGFTRREYLY